MTRRTIGGKYELASEQGRGAMGTVYLATDTKTDRLVAVKLLNPDIARYPKAVQRFKSEAKTLARLNHPNVATLHDFEAEGAEPFMIMEFIAGETLEAVIKKQRMPLEVAVPVFCQILDGIGSAHAKGVIHRDIKPSNIILTRDGVPKVIDFGIARVEGAEGMTRAGAVLGTLAYMSPEQVEGKDLDSRSDIYSLGVILYEMASGKNPFDRGTDFATMNAQVNEPAPSLTQTLDAFPQKLDEAIQRALSKEPEKRFQQTSEFRTLVASCVDPAVFVSSPVGAYLASLSRPGPEPLAKGRSGAAKETVAELEPSGPEPDNSPFDHHTQTARKTVGLKLYAVAILLLLLTGSGIWATKLLIDLRRPAPPLPISIERPHPPADWMDVSTPSQNVDASPPIATEQVDKVQKLPAPQSDASARRTKIDKPRIELTKQQAESREKERRKQDALKILNEPLSEPK